jgi:hypothetical protein
MALLLVGVALLGLGLFAGGVLVLAPLGVVPWSSDVLLWAIFPLFSVIGYAVFVIGARSSQIRWLSQVASWLLLALALASAAALVGVAASIVHPAGGTLSLWYVFVVAGLIGALGAATRAAAPGAEKASA